MRRCGNRARLRIFRLESSSRPIMDHWLKSSLVFVAAILILPARTQAQPAPPRRTPAPATQTAAAVPNTRIAVIYSQDFQDPKTGITRFAALLAKLNAEFQKTQDDLNATAQRLRGLQAEIATLQNGPNPSPTLIQTKTDQLDQQKRDYQRRGEDAQAAYQKRRNEVFNPLQDDISKALDVYARARGITLILDGSMMPLVYAADGLDITRAFMADYNSKNPAPAATPPKPAGTTPKPAGTTPN